MSGSDWTNKRRKLTQPPTRRDRPDLPPRQQPLSDLLEPGFCVGEFVVQERVGHGGFGTVYRSAHARTGELVALKVLHSDLVFSEQAVARFEREVGTLRRLEHPNIVEVFTAGELHDGRPYYAMEWLKGRNLHEEIRVRGPLSPVEALLVLEDVGSALSRAHATGVIHRDLKSTNLIAVPDGSWFRCTLVDFGIAKLLEPGLAACLRTTTGMRLGTPATMAPEQILGGAVDARTDVYAFGLLLYELVTGELPFAGSSDDEVERMHLFNKRPDASELASVPPEFDAVVHRALARVPDARYQRIEDLLGDLRRVVRGKRSLAASETRRGIAVCVEIFAASGLGDLDDGQLDVIETVIDEARDLCGASELVVVLEANDLLLAALALPRAPPAADAERRRVEALASTLAARLEPAAPSGVRVRVRTHMADVQVSVQGEQITPTGGPLLDVESWPPHG